MMKKYYFLIIIIATFFVACQDDPVVIDAELHFDGTNVTAPLFNDPEYACAARFSSGITQEFTGQNLTEVEFFLTNIPNRISLKVYGQGNSTSPGTLIYESDLIGSVVSNSWNRHVLTNTVAINGQDIWIAIECSQTGSLQTVGCDGGPSVSGGDMVFINSANQWQTFETLTGGESINWNIRGHVE